MPSEEYKNLSDWLENIVNMTDQEIQNVENDIKAQVEYNHVFKRGSANEVREAGRHNLKVIEKVKELRAAMRDGDTHYQKEVSSK